MIIVNKSSKPLKDTNYLVDFPEMADERGIITVIEQTSHFNWAIKRVFIIRDVSKILTRGNHAHKSLQQIIIAVAGSFSVNLFDGNAWNSYNLTSPTRGLLIPKMIWLELKDFSENAVVLVIADQEYEEEDYIHDFGTYKDMVS